MTEIISKIPARIKNAAVGGHVCGTEDIIDDVKNKTQQQINTEVEESLGDGGSVDERIAAAKDEVIGDAASDYNTLGKLEDKVQAEATRAEAAEEQLRTLYNNLQQSKPIPVPSLPATGEAGKIYRLAGTTSYADYMYAEGALTTPIKMAEYDNAIDDEPTAGSNNLVKSGGVYEAIMKATKDYILIEGEFIEANDLLLDENGQTFTSTGYYTTDYIEIAKGFKVDAHGLFINQASRKGYCIYDETKTLLSAGGSPSVADLNVSFVVDSEDAKYIRLSLTPNNESWYKLEGYLDKGESVPYTETIITVKAGGTIGTDCAFTDIESALDSINDNSSSKRYIVFVKNGTYDITGINYLGFKNYVTVRGESIDGVVIRNSTQTSDQNVVCFDPAKYGNNIIDYAAIENMTLSIFGGKCCVHADGTSIKSGGKILIKGVHLINENPDSVQGRGGVNLGLNGGQTIEITNCYGNVLAYAHSRVNPSVAAAPNYFIAKGCHLNYIGYYDLNDKVENGKHNHFIVNGCVCDYIGVGVGYQAAVKTYNSIVNEIGNDNKFNWVYIYGQGSIVGYDSWFTKYPVCSSIHRVAENHTGNTITKGTFVSVVRSQYNGVPSAANAQPAYRYNIVPYSGGELFGVAMEDIADGGNGIIQVDGKILIADNNYTAGQYITLNENGVPVVGTKENAIGIVTDANQQYLGTLVLLRKRDYDYIL